MSFWVHACTTTKSYVESYTRGTTHILHYLYIRTQFTIYALDLFGYQQSRAETKVVFSPLNLRLHSHQGTEPLWFICIHNAQEISTTTSFIIVGRA